MERTRLARNLVQAAQDFYREALWRRLHSNQITAIHAPGQPEPVFASILGSAPRPVGAKHPVVPVRLDAVVTSTAGVAVRTTGVAFRSTCTPP